jgi:hypothetical protein
MPNVNLSNAPTDVLVAALAHSREPEVYTERNGGQINRPDFTDYLVAITGQNLSSMTKLIISSGHLPAYKEAAQEKQEEAFQIIAARINKKEVQNVGLLKVEPSLLERLVRFTDPKARQQQQFEAFLATGCHGHSVADVFEAAKKVRPNWACGDLVHYVRCHPGLSSVIVTAQKLAAASLLIPSICPQRPKVTEPQNHL